MHPHENPVYKQKIVGFFNTAYRRGHLSLGEDTVDQEFKKNLVSTSRRAIMTYAIGCVWTYIFDKNYLRKLTGERAHVRRILGVVTGLTMSSWLSREVAIGPQNGDVYWKMALKYEKQLHVLYPELKLYYSDETKPIYTDRFKQSENTDDRFFDYQTPVQEYPRYEDPTQSPESKYPSSYLYPGEKK